MGIEDALTAQAGFPHPFHVLIKRGGGRLDQSDRRVGKKILKPLQCLSHRKRRRKPALVGDDMQEFRATKAGKTNVSPRCVSAWTAASVLALAGWSAMAGW